MKLFKYIFYKWVLFNKFGYNRNLYYCPHLCMMCKYRKECNNKNDFMNYN